ncbi:MAG: EI24 domain-containing protein, partial [Verrucomicrobiota bacterium]
RMPVSIRSIIQWYYTGAGLISPVLERRGNPVRDRLKFCRNHRGKSMGLGAGFTLMMMIPLVGWYFAPTIGAIAATLLVIDETPEREVPDLPESGGTTTEPSPPSSE